MKEFNKGDADGALYKYLEGQNRSLNLVLRGAVRFGPFFSDLYAKELEDLKAVRDGAEDRAIEGSLPCLRLSSTRRLRL